MVHRSGANRSNQRRELIKFERRDLMILVGCEADLISAEGYVFQHDWAERIEICAGE